MSTLAQITANPANAKHSTGPVTPQGKSRVARNAIRHGLTGKHLVVDDDEHEEFEDFQQSLIEELDPQGAVETITFHELLHAAWNLRRYRRIEAVTGHSRRGGDLLTWARRRGRPPQPLPGQRPARFPSRPPGTPHPSGKRPLPAPSDNTARPTPPAVAGELTIHRRSVMRSL
jgi:hypothetical protein